MSFTSPSRWGGLQGNVAQVYSCKSQRAWDVAFSCVFYVYAVIPSYLGLVLSRLGCYLYKALEVIDLLNSLVRLTRS